MDEAGVAGWVTSDELSEAGRFVREGGAGNTSRGEPSSAGNWGRMCGLPMMQPGPRSSTGTGYTSGFRTVGGVWPSVCPMSPARSTSSPRRGISAVLRRVTCPPPSRRCPAIRCCLPPSGARRRRFINMPGVRGWTCCTTCGWRRWISQPESLSGASAAGRRSGSRCIVPTGLSRYILCSSREDY